MPDHKNILNGRNVGAAMIAVLVPTGVYFGTQTEGATRAVIVCLTILNIFLIEAAVRGWRGGKRR